MSEIASIRCFQVVVDASPEDVFDFVSDLNNLPRWSIHFCKGIRVIPGDGAIVTSPGGEVYFGITGDRDLGVLDWWSGPTMESAQRWPTRVVALPDGRSLYQVTAILSPVEASMPNLEQIFADELGMLKQVLERQLIAA